MKKILMLLMIFIGLINFTLVSCTSPTEKEEKTEVKKDHSTRVVMPFLFWKRQLEKATEKASYRQPSQGVTHSQVIHQPTEVSHQSTTPHHQPVRITPVKPRPPVRVMPRIIHR